MRCYTARVSPSSTPTNAAADRFIVRFWGVRGSIPTPGPATARYGGNTTCIEVRCGSQIFIIDLGSGMRPLGDALIASGQPLAATILVTHLHWDHVQGFPFFGPAFFPSGRFSMHCEHRADTSLPTVLNAQMSEPMFPIGLDSMNADFTFHEFQRNDTLEFGDVVVRTAPLNHPGGATAFRFEYRGQSYVHASDHEHVATLHQPLVDIARDANCMTYDSTYTDAEYAGEGGGEPHVGWGHSTWEEALKLADAAEVDTMVLFHHDPDHTDARLDEIGAQARVRRPGTLVAREGMVIDVSDDCRVVA
ncbi:MAG: phosphoribosyl 1,2-cyclic phosphodiesterase [Myxococcota bacterium]|jgi:phosphoribosyl 1,2-cyclic phosphodiesterase